MNLKPYFIEGDNGGNAPHMRGADSVHEFWVDKENNGVKIFAAVGPVYTHIRIGKELYFMDSKAYNEATDRKEMSYETPLQEFIDLILANPVKES